MTASSGEKPWHGRTSTGRPRTPGYTMRPSRAVPMPSPIAITASRMTMSRPYAPRTLTSYCLPGSQTCCHGQGQVSNRVTVPHPPGPPSADDGTRATANSRPANTGTSAWHMGGLTWNSNVHSDAPTQGVAHHSGELPAS